MGQGSQNAIRSTPQDGVDFTSPLPGNSPKTAAPALSVHIHNMEQIGSAYGAAAALAASDHVRNIMKFVLHDRDQAGLAEYVLRRLSEHPVVYDGQRFHLNASLAPTSDPGGCAIKASTVHGNPAFPDDAWCRCYRADMALAVTLFDAMRDDRLALAWQPVRSAEDPEEILYHEGLLRIVTPGGAIETAGDAIEALERLGLIRALDRYVMAEAIRDLGIYRMKRIGVNISAQSLVRDEWWARIVESLEGQPQLAGRLHIEITETAPMASVTQALDLVSTLRRLRCRIVIDDFGAGHAAIRLLLAFKPDIVKIDRFFVHYAKSSAQGFAALGHLIGLAGSLGALPVVEGVETASESEMVRKAGCCWQQGYHLGRPSIVRSWGLGVNANGAGSGAGGAPAGSEWTTAARRGAPGLPGLLHINAEY